MEVEFQTESKSQSVCVGMNQLIRQAIKAHRNIKAHPINLVIYTDKKTPSNWLRHNYLNIVTIYLDIFILLYIFLHISCVIQPQEL